MERLAPPQQVRPERQLGFDHHRGLTVVFRLVYYAVMFLVLGVLVGVLYLGSLLE